MCMYSRSPFGEPDGIKLRFREVSDYFVQNEYVNFSSLITDVTCRKVRIIVGEKGSGKTVYLKRYRSYVKKQLACERGVYVSFCDSEPPSTEAVKRTCKTFASAGIQTTMELWAKLWRCAIFNSLCSSILYSPDLSPKIDVNNIGALKSFFENGDIFPDVRFEIEVFGALNDILSNLHTIKQIKDYVDSRQWRELETILVPLFRDELPEIFFFIDGIDEWYHDAPAEWVQCQMGLFYRTWKMVNSELFFDMFNVIITVRKIVYHKILYGNGQANASTYENSENILKLIWDRKSIEAFFREKISVLDNVYFREDSGKKDIESWLGVQCIPNSNLNCDEPIMSYILRHINLLPRDVVNVGNALSSIKHEMNENNGQDAIQLIRNKVLGVSRVACYDMLTTCEIQALSILGLSAYHCDIVDEFAPSLKDILYNSIKATGTVSITKSELNFILSDIKQQALEQLGMDIRPEVLIDVLWRNNGIGFYDTISNKTEKLQFFDDRPQFIALPYNKSKYAFSTLLKDYIGIKDN